MDTWDVKFLRSGNGEFGFVEVSVQAKNRGKAITKASKIARRHRDMAIECTRRNPATGGGSKRG